MEMEQLKNGLITEKYTKVYHENVSEMRYNAPHHFLVTRADDQSVVVSRVDFQEGPIKEEGVNGVMNEDLIAMVIKRLECFQDTSYKCRENALAITKLEEALLWLRKRTLDREARGVEGTHKV